MNKLTNILLAVIIAIGVTFLIVSLNTDQKTQELNLGYGGYNELGYSHPTQETVDVGIEGIDSTNGSTTAFKILSENSGRQYAAIQLDTVGTGDVTLWFGTTTFSTGATSTYASSTQVLGVGYKLSTTTERSEYIIDPDNLWKGEVWGIAEGTTSTVKVIDK